MVYYIKHFLTLHSVNKTLFDTTEYIVSIRHFLTHIVSIRHSLGRGAGQADVGACQSVLRREAGAELARRGVASAEGAPPQVLLLERGLHIYRGVLNDVHPY